MTVTDFLAEMFRTFVQRKGWVVAPREQMTAQQMSRTVAGSRAKELYQHQVEEAIANQTIIRCLITQASRQELIVRLSEAEDAPIGRMSAAEFDDREYAGLEGFVGRMVEVIILSFDAERQVAEVSRRRAREIQAEKLLPTLRVGQVIKGTVWVIQEFGAFLEIGGIHALLPINEISHAYVRHPGEVLRRGEEVAVKIIGLDLAARKIRVSRKAAVDPWETARSVYQRNDVVLGTISGVRNEQLWVRPNQYFGLEILCPAPPQCAAKVGTPVSVKLNVVDAVGKRLRGRIINWEAF